MSTPEFLTPQHGSKFSVAQRVYDNSTRASISPKRPDPAISMSGDAIGAFKFGSTNKNKAFVDFKKQIDRENHGLRTESQERMRVQ